MPFLSKTPLALGTLLLIHACYSAHEYASLASSHAPTSLHSASTTPSLQSQAASSLPLDISLETLASVLLICVGLVLGAEELRPISWRVWAGKVERGQGANEGEGYAWLERRQRKGFLDIRGQRRDFAAWVRGQDGAKLE